jgi:hypothetical protein
MADGLAGVDEEQGAGRPRQAADLGDRVDQAVMGRHVVDGDEPYVLAERGGEGVERDLPVFVVRDDLYLHATVAGHVQEGDRVAAVFAGRGQDAVARPEPHAVEGHVPRAGGALGDGDLVGVRPDEQRSSSRRSHIPSVTGRTLRVRPRASSPRAWHSWAISRGG